MTDLPEQTPEIDKVGPGRPPPNGRWQKGCSGNPTGKRHLQEKTMTGSPDRYPANDLGPSPIGYCNPPEDTQYSKARSGNLKGRPKREPTYADLFRKEQNKRIWVEENGKRMRITKRRA